MGIYDRATREKVVLASGNIFLNVMGEYRLLPQAGRVCACAHLRVCARPEHVQKIQPFVETPVVLV